jgi:hypothetical protein
MCYKIEECTEAWGARFDIYRNGSLITTSESRSDAESYIEWHREKEKEPCYHIGIVSISENECQCVDCLRTWPKETSFKSDFPYLDRG